MNVKPLAIATVLWLGLASQAGYALTLEQALHSALNHSPALHQQFARFQSTKEQRREVRSEYYPQVWLQAAIGPEHTEFRSGQSVDEDLTRDEIGLRVSQSLFSGFDTSANSQRLEHEAEADRFSLIAQAENLAVDVCEAYLNSYQAQQLLELTVKHVEDHEAVMEDVKKLISNGFANEADLAQVSARLANAKASLASAKGNQMDARAQFLRVVGSEPNALINPIPDEALLPNSLEAALDWAQQSHPQLHSAQADVFAAQQEVKANKAGYYPRISLEGYANKNHDVGGLEGPEEDYRLMLTLQYDLYNGGRDSARSKSSNWRYNEALQIQRETFEELKEGTRFAWNALQSLHEQESLRRTSVDASTLAEIGYTTQFKLGKRSLLDLLNAKVEVFVSRKNYIATEHDLTLAKYRLLNATGRLGYALRVIYPEQWQNEEDES